MRSQRNKFLAAVIVPVVLAIGYVAAWPTLHDNTDAAERSTAITTTTTTAPRLLAPVQPVASSWLTRDGKDLYHLKPTSTGVFVTAPITNTGTNSRMIVAERSAPTSMDQESCATWYGPTSAVAQPGIALRYSNDNGRVRAVTVSNNVWGGARGMWNVHEWDTALPEGQLPASSPGSITIGDAATPPSLPWRMCARVEARELAFKMWGGDQAEPSWDDPASTGTVTLTAASDHPGQPGIYMGHLSPNEGANFLALDSKQIGG